MEGEFISDVPTSLCKRYGAETAALYLLDNAHHVRFYGHGATVVRNLKDLPPVQFWASLHVYGRNPETNPIV